MTREEMVEKAAAVLVYEQSSGLCRLGKRCGLCDCGGAVEGYARDQAAAVVDAILPQVSTVEELEALPIGTVVVCDGQPYKRFTYGWYAPGSQSEYATRRLPDPPLTVVWRPS